ncbi:MAG TPA: transporter substrate-binding domain-containing protein, partial [Chloroflexia bacterium]|nr:transporter substrate-binding domain-containing protein [Chloroflexia bacterium]
MRVGRALVDSLLLLLLGGLAALIWQGTRPPPDVAWDRVQAAGVLQIGTDATYPPFESIAKDPATGRDAFTGYDVDLGRTIAAQVGVRAEFVSIALDGQ